jgi:vitamin B12 transporter
MHRRAIVAAIAAACSFFRVYSVHAGASDTSDTSDASDTAVDQVVVVANKAPAPLSSIGNSVTVLDAAAIRDSQAVVLSDILTQTPGVSFVRSGGVGAATSVFIRGAESDQTVVLLDGVVLSDPSLPGGGFDFAHLLTADVDRIEILRGAQSTLYGSQAMGGVVSIRTTEPAGSFSGGASIEGGSHGTSYLTAGVGGNSGLVSWRLAGNRYDTAGIPDFDQVFGGLRNCAARIEGGSGRLDVNFTPELELDLRSYFTRSRTEFDGYDNPTFTFGDDAEYGENRQFLGYAGMTLRSADMNMTNRIAVQYTDSETRNYDPNAPVDGYGLSANPETFYGFGTNVREEYQGTWDFAARAHAVFGAQHERSTIDTDSPAYEVTPMPLNRQVAINSGYVQLRGEPLQGLTLTAGGRYDHHDVYGGHTSGELAAAWSLPDDRTVLRASVGQGFKAPSLYQLYSSYGNLALRPEQSRSWDAGVERHLATASAVLSATYFQHDSRELIEYFACPAANALCLTEPQGFYANIARASAHGVELTGAFDPTDRVHVAANYTLTQTRDLSPGSTTYGEVLPNRPKNAANASASYRWRSTLTTALSLQYAGPSLDEASGPIWLGGYVLTQFRVSYPVGTHFELYGRLDNIADKHYETTYQYGNLGRSAYAGVRATF